MGSYGSLGSAAPYVKAGSEGAISASVGASIDYMTKNRNKQKKKRKGNNNNDNEEGGVYYYNGNVIDTRPYRPNGYY